MEIFCVRKKYHILYKSARRETGGHFILYSVFPWPWAWKKLPGKKLLQFFRAAYIIVAERWGKVV